MTHIATGLWLFMVSMLVVLAVGRVVWRVRATGFWLAVRKKRNLVGVAFSAFHVLIIGCMAYVILTTTDPVWPMLWLVVAMFDAPLSLLFFVVDAVILPYFPPVHLVANPVSRLNDLNNFWVPFVFFLTAGTAWWFMLPRMIIGRSTE